MFVYVMHIYIFRDTRFRDKGDGLAWTMTSLKIGFEAKGVKNCFRAQSKANVLCSLSSIPTTITCFSTMANAIMLVKLFSLAFKSARTS